MLFGMPGGESGLSLILRRYGGSWWMTSRPGRTRVAALLNYEIHYGEPDERTLTSDPSR